MQPLGAWPTSPLGMAHITPRGASSAAQKQHIRAAKRHSKADCPSVPRCMDSGHPSSHLSHDGTRQQGTRQQVRSHRLQRCYEGVHPSVQAESEATREYWPGRGCRQGGRQGCRQGPRGSGRREGRAGASRIGPKGTEIRTMTTM